MVHEGRPHKQAIAIALSNARRTGRGACTGLPQDGYAGRRGHVDAAHLQEDARDLDRIDDRAKQIRRAIARLRRRDRDELFRAGNRLGYPEILTMPWGTRFFYPDVGVIIDAEHGKGSYLDVVDGEVPTRFFIGRGPPMHPQYEARSFRQAEKSALRLS